MEEGESLDVDLYSISHGLAFYNPAGSGLQDSLTMAGGCEAMSHKNTKVPLSEFIPPARGNGTEAQRG